MLECLRLDANSQPTERSGVVGAANYSRSSHASHRLSRGALERLTPIESRPEGGLLSLKKLTLFVLVFVAAIAAWCQPSFAQQTIGAGSTTIDATGIASGVIITPATSGTLIVPNGDNIYNLNSSGGNVVNSTLTAVNVGNVAATNGQVTFQGSSSVFGTMGQSSTATLNPVSYTHLRAHETGRNLVCRLLLEKKKTTQP